MEAFVKVGRTRIFKNLFPQFVDRLKKELEGCKTVLDLGCGPNSPIQYCSVYSVGVELFEPYRDSRKEETAGKQRFIMNTSLEI